MLTVRTIETSWDKESQEHVKQVTDSPVHVNPDHIAWFRSDSDAPEKYTTHIRMAGGWDLFVVEHQFDIANKLNLAQVEARNDIREAIAGGIVDSR